MYQSECVCGVRNGDTAHLNGVELHTEDVRASSRQYCKTRRSQTVE
jgi:hypothetical protein